MSEQFSETYLFIKNECEQLGITPTNLLLNAGMNPDLIQKWKRKEPKTIQLLNQIKAAIELQKQMKAE